MKIWSQLGHKALSYCAGKSSPLHRAIWKKVASASASLIPIAVYPATREDKFSFRQLQSTDLSPIKYKKVAEADSKEVSADQIVKGYEYERGRYVVLKEEDFAKVRIESTHSIDITDFVDLGQVDPKFFYKPYFLEPQKGGEKAYALLHRALSGTGKIGIAKVVISNREHLASVKPDGLFLILELMHFASEILSPEELKNGPVSAITEKELKMAQSLIDSMSVSWEPEKYRDEYRTAVMEIIEQKAQHKEIAGKPAPAVRATNVVDLVKVLQESLNRNQSLKPKAEWCSIALAALPPVGRSDGSLPERSPARSARSCIASFGPIPLFSCLK